MQTPAANDQDAEASPSQAHDMETQTCRRSHISTAVGHVRPMETIKLEVRSESQTSRGRGLDFQFELAQYLETVVDKARAAGAELSYVGATPQEQGSGRGLPSQSVSAGEMLMGDRAPCRDDSPERS